MAQTLPTTNAATFATVVAVPNRIEFAASAAVPYFRVAFASSVYDASGPGTQNLICPSALTVVDCPGCSIENGASGVAQIGGVSAPTTIQTGQVPAGVAGSSTQLVTCGFRLALNSGAAANGTLAGVWIQGRFAGLVSKGNTAYLQLFVAFARLPVQLEGQAMIVAAPLTSATQPQPLVLEYRGAQLTAWMTTQQATIAATSTGTGYFCCPSSNFVTLSPLGAGVLTSPSAGSITIGPTTHTIAPPCFAVPIDNSLPGMGRAVCSYTLVLQPQLPATVSVGVMAFTSLLGPRFTIDVNGFGTDNFTVNNSRTLVSTALIAPPIVPPGPVPIVAVTSDSILCSIIECIVNVKTRVVAPRKDAYTYFEGPCMWRPNGTSTGTLTVPGAGVDIMVTGTLLSEARVDIPGDSYYVMLDVVARYAFNTAAYRLNATAASAGVLKVRGPYYNFWTNPPCWVSGAAAVSNTTLATLAVQFYDPTAVLATAWSVTMVSRSETLISVAAPLILGVPLTSAPTPIVQETHVFGTPLLRPQVYVERQGFPLTRVLVPSASVEWMLSTFGADGVFRGVVDLEGLSVHSVGFNYTVTLVPPFFDGFGTWLQRAPIDNYPTFQATVAPFVAPFTAACHILPVPLLTLPRSGTRRIECDFRVDTTAIRFLYRFQMPPFTAQNTTSCVPTMLLPNTTLATVHISTFRCVLDVTGIAPVSAVSYRLTTELVHANGGSPFITTLRTIPLEEPSRVTNTPLVALPSRIMIPNVTPNVTRLPVPITIRGPVAVASNGAAMTTETTPPVRLTMISSPGGRSTNYSFEPDSVVWAVVGSEWSVTVELPAASLEVVDSLSFTLTVALRNGVAWEYVQEVPTNWGVEPAIVTVTHPIVTPEFLVFTTQQQQQQHQTEVHKAQLREKKVQGKNFVTLYALAGVATIFVLLRIILPAIIQKSSQQASLQANDWPVSAAEDWPRAKKSRLPNVMSLLISQPSGQRSPASLQYTPASTNGANVRTSQTFRWDTDQGIRRRDANKT